MLSVGLAVILSIVIYFVWLKRIYRQYRQCVAQNGTGYIVSLIQKASIAKDPDGICSHGNYYNQGEIRKKELLKSCGVLGIPAAHLTVIDCRYLSCAGKLPEGCCALALETVNIFRKYVSIFELPISWFIASDFISIIWKREYGQAKRAMCCHDSQMLWFRQVYLLFSRYMFINTFRLISEERQR
ncbi:N-acetylglucosaminyl-phosphatidylinositol de-N-acetylase-like isoform X3 [Acipenser ruthenus]|uniref:N-acetylglucosaminyl-phosphatidylinositol de-N-acetylase-like isoform X3 n=1 Tax=Acipenser ruthenus TaxID=7906 RepID=UPI00274053D6|nr:N-acetylglucosaminyl-phosphatidylinositol de-N-acetylase-like isoform X3 [Acipenser ruthenus]